MSCHRSPRLLTLLTLVVAPLAAQPHGGAFRRPNLPAPAPAGGAAGFATPGSASQGGPSTGGGGARSLDPGAWDQWWVLNRDLILRRGEAVYGRQVASGPAQGQAGPAGGVRPGDAYLRQQVVPALLEVLEKERDVDLLTASLVALGKLGLEPEPADEVSVLGALTAFLDHGNEEVAEAAVLAVGILGRADCAPLLAGLLHGDELGRKALGRRRIPRRMRALAAYGLGVVGRRASAGAVRTFCVHHLAEALSKLEGTTPDVGVACVVSMGLVRLDPAGVDLVGEEGRPPVGSGREGQVAFLLELLQEGQVEDEVAAFLPVALARLSGDLPALRVAVVRDLAGRLGPRSKVADEIRVGCVQALGYLGTAEPEPLEALLRERLLLVAREGERLERNLALVALGRCGGRSAGGALGEVPQVLRSFLMERLSRGSATEKPWAALGVGLLEHGRAQRGEAPALGTLAALRHALEGARNPDAVGALCLALGLAGDREAIPALLERAQGGDEAARGHAVTALGLLGASEARDLLRSMATEGQRPGLAREAAIALALLGDRDLQGQLAQQAARERFLSHQVSALLALAYVGDARALPPLLEVLQGKRQQEVARAFAAVGLGLVADKDPLPWNHPLAAEANWWKAPPTLLDPSTGRGILDLF